MENSHTKRFSEETTVFVFLDECANPIATGKRVSKVSAMKPGTRIALIGWNIVSWIKGFLVLKTAKARNVRWFQSETEAETWALTEHARCSD